MSTGKDLYLQSRERQQLTAKMAAASIVRAAILPLALLSIPTPALAEPTWKSGAEAYNQVCGYCHEGGVVGPALKGRNLPPEFFIALARNGSRAMPAFSASFIDDKTLREVADYLSKSTVETK